MTDSNNAQNSTAGASLEFKNITKQYRGQQSPAVDNLSLKIPAGELVAFVGPSGCGKTTSLKMINRLVEPTSGQILINGDDAIKRNPTELRRQIGYVIQGGGLLPHISVADNIAIVPSLLKWPKDKIAKRTDELLDMVGLDPSIYRDRFPRELSGGQQQRVGVARGLAADPPVVLMDEPFGAVDPITRARLQDELVNIRLSLARPSWWLPTISMKLSSLDIAFSSWSQVPISRSMTLPSRFWRRRHLHSSKISSVLVLR